MDCTLSAGGPWVAQRLCIPRVKMCWRRQGVSLSLSRCLWDIPRSNQTPYPSPFEAWLPFCEAVKLTCCPRHFVSGRGRVIQVWSFFIMDSGANIFFFSLGGVFMTAYTIFLVLSNLLLKHRLCNTKTVYENVWGVFIDIKVINKILTFILI